MMGCETCNGACCKYLQFCQTHIGYPKELIEHLETWCGKKDKVIAKPKLFGLITRLYILIYKPCKQLGKDGKCKIYNSRLQYCREYLCELDEFIGFKKGGWA